MKALRRFAARLLSSVTRQGDEARLQEELEAHLSMQTTDNVRAGLPPVEASRQARLKFGSVEAARAEYRAGQSLPILDDLFQDVRHTFRYLRRALNGAVNGQVL
jgi:hypothetical protein